MGHNKLKFSKLLEQYVFSVSEKFIGLVDREAQAELIRLFTSTDKEQLLNVKPLKVEINAIEELIASHQVTIDTTLSYMIRIDTLVEKAEKTIPSTSKNSGLISRYLSLKNKYGVALIKVRALQQTDINRIKEK